MITKDMISKDYLGRRVGSISQVGGLRHYRLSGGLSDGVEAVDVRTGAGLCYTVLPGRGMDIAWADFKGLPVSYISRTGVVSANHYDPRGMEWLKGFFAGLLTTCGLSNVGWPGPDTDKVIGERHYGLHDRISCIPAEQLSLFEDWTDDRHYRMKVRGLMREATVHAENLTLTREISSDLGENRIRIDDVVSNIGYDESPLMILYHVNLGFPLLAADSVLLTTAARVVPGTPEAERERDDYGRFTEPCHGYGERLYHHELDRRPGVLASAGLVNDRLGYGLAVSFSAEELPQLTEWKVMKETEYVVGIEPANTKAVGRAKARAEGTLDTLKPGESRRFTLFLDVLDGPDAIAAFRTHVASAAGRPAGAA